MASNRIIREQFSEGTTVDGNRIQSALDTVEGRINAIPRGDILPRYAEQTIHSGFMPPYQVFPTWSGPWGPLYNSSSWVTAPGLDDVVNELRVKGCYNGNIASPTTGDQFVWSTSVQHTSPCIVNELHFNMVRNISVAPWGGTGDSVHALISVDGDSDKGDRHLNSFEVAKHNFADSSWRFRRSAPSAPVVDMDPPHTYDLDGNIVSFKNLGVLIPAGARVRYQLVLPASAVAGWSTTPYRLIIAGLTVHYLEEVV